MGTRLILIEGMVGAGKSTTAGRVAEWLTGRGEDARAFHEFAEDHPIRTRAVDLLRASYPEPVWTPGDVGPDGLAADRGVYAVEQWGRLAERCRDGRLTCVLESTFLQNSVLPAFLNGAPADKVIGATARIQEQLAPARPLFVYLRPVDVAAALERTHQARGEPWSSWNAASMTEIPWSKARGLTGLEAAAEFYRAWEGVVQLLFDGYPYPKLMIDDPQDDWDATLRRITEALLP